MSRTHDDIMRDGTDTASANDVATEASLETVSHTPRPWEAEIRIDNRHSRAIVRLDGKTLACYGTSREIGLSVEHARLIAAAPDLLDASRNVVVLIELWMSGAFAHMGVIWKTEADQPPALQQLRAAIAKAEGR